MIALLARYRRWTWPIFALLCDIKMIREGRRCYGWTEHRPKEHGGYM